MFRSDAATCCPITRRAEQASAVQTVAALLTARGWQPPVTRGKATSTRIVFLVTAVGLLWLGTQMLMTAVHRSSGEPRYLSSPRRARQC